MGSVNPEAAAPLRGGGRGAAGVLNIVLVEPEIPQNTGNISRTCAATRSALHLIKPLGFDISERAVRRAGLDYWPMVDLHVYESLDDFFARTGAELAVVMNRSGMEGNEAGDAALRAWCAERRLPLLAELPFDRAAAEQYAGGGLIARTSPLWERRFRALAEALLQRAEQGGRHA